MKKIIVFGFPHSGTSILKSIIGHIDSVYEIVDETPGISRSIQTDKEYVLCKYPFTLDCFFDEKYKEYYKIFIIRNPIWVYSSLNKRFANIDFPKDHDITEYLNTLNKFIKYSNDPIDNLYTIKYEDLFANDYLNIKRILSDIGLNYSDKIFDNSQYSNYIHNSCVDIPDEVPKNEDHVRYRTYQINQPFVDNNNDSKINLTDYQTSVVTSDRQVLSLYTKNKLIIDDINNLRNST